MSHLIDRLDSKEEIELTKAAQRCVINALDRATTGSIKDLEERMGKGDQSALLRLPPKVLRLMADLLGTLAEGKAVAVVPKDLDFTTNEAADYLNVSRPYLVRLLDAGQIRFHKVGAHRRIRFEDALRYKEEQTRKSNEALQALADQAQELGLDD